MKIQLIREKLAQVTSIILLVVSGLIAPFLLGMPIAQAINLNQTPGILAETNPVDQVFGEGTTEQVKGKLKEDIGTAERATSEAKGNLEGAAGQVKGAAKQAEGRAQQEIGKTQNRVEDASEDLEDAGNNIGDALKNLFGQ